MVLLSSRYLGKHKRRVTGTPSLLFPFFHSLSTTNKGVANTKTHTRHKADKNPAAHILFETQTNLLQEPSAILGYKHTEFIGIKPWMGQWMGQNTTIA
jgi:hypothetical protein